MGKKDNNFNVKWFKDQIARRNTSQRQIAMKLGIHQGVISHMFKGRRKMPLEEATRWADLLGVRLEDIIANAGIDIKGGHSDLVGVRNKTIQVVGWVDSELNVHLGRPKGSETAPNPTGQPNTAAVRCQTAGGVFAGIDGAILYYTPPLEKFDPEVLTRLCIVKVKGNPAFLLRTINRGYTQGRYNLSSFSKGVKEEDVFVISAVPVLWMKL